MSDQERLLASYEAAQEAGAVAAALEAQKTKDEARELHSLVTKNSSKHKLLGKIYLWMKSNGLIPKTGSPLRQTIMFLSQRGNYPQIRLLVDDKGEWIASAVVPTSRNERFGGQIGSLAGERILAELSVEEIIGR